MLGMPTTLVLHELIVRRVCVLPYSIQKLFL